MIVRADLDHVQAEILKTEALRQGCSINELVRRILAKHIYAQAVEDAHPRLKTFEPLGEEWT